MKSVFKIDEELKGAFKIKQGYENILKNNPDDFAINLSLKSINYHIEQIQASLMSEKLAREKEVINIRLFGNLAKFGTIPLNILSKISEYFSNSIYLTAAYLQHHDKYKERDLKEISNNIDLRLAGIYNGSTKLLITGESNPDLFGNSILETTLERTFELLNSKESESFISSVEEIGEKSTERIKLLLKTLNNDNLEIDLTWNSPTGKENVWAGSREEIISISNSLQNIEISKPIINTIEAEIITLSSKGNFEIKDKNENSFKGKFILDILDIIKQHHIGDIVFCDLETKSIKNKATNQVKNVYRLLNVNNI